MSPARHEGAIASPTAPLDEPVHQILDLIDRRDAAEVARIVRALVAGRGVDAAVTTLAAVQRQVGARWETGRYSVADEHAATAIVDRALTEAAAVSTPATAADRTVVVACVENEWHVLPARMLSEQLRVRGWDPLFLGASLPADDLTRFAAEVAPVAVVLSCSMTVNLPGAIRSVRAVHAAGVPVAIGGAALAGGARHGHPSGADEVVTDVDELVELLTSWAETPPTTTGGPDADFHLTVEARAAMVDVAYARVLDRVTPLADAPDPVRARVRRDLGRLVDALEASLLVDDDDLMADFATWLAAVSNAAGLPDGLVAIALSAIAEAAQQVGVADDAVRTVLDAGAAGVR